MKLDFSSFPLRSTAFSDRPMGFLDGDPRSMLTAITEIALIETGSPEARENWQATQFRNLLTHAAQRSEFWRKCIGSNKPSGVKVADLPVLTRQGVVRQVTSEGSLLQPNDRLATKTHATSGSTGIPVHFFISEINGHYNMARSLAQYFIEGRDLSFNRTRLKQAHDPVQNGISIQKTESWLGSLAGAFRSGTSRYIEYFEPDMNELRRELEQEEVGYLVCYPQLMETMLGIFDPKFLKDAKTKMWLPIGENVNRDVRATLADLGIPVRSSYSSEENGAIGFECDCVSDFFHVATSNVIVEVVDTAHDIEGEKLGRILVTHLHSYATPFIRYDLGDLACLRDSCPCGHQGPTIYNLKGREASFLKRRDGGLSPFRIRGQQLSALARFTEYRMRQTELTKIVIELGGRSEVSENEVAALTSFLKERAGPEFEIEVRACHEIDWGQSIKRPGFISEVANRS